jgi:hypothetical protein
MQSACAVLYFHLWLVQHYHILSTLSSKRHDFRKKVAEHERFVSIFLQLLYETFITLRIIHSGIITNYVGLHVKYLLFLSNFKET